MGESLAGEVADRFSVLSNGTRPIILTGTGDAGGNREYLLTVGEASDLVIAKGGFGIVGDVMRLG